MATPQVTFSPFRGKLALFQKLFVDTDLYVHGGVAFVGVKEREDCDAAGQSPARGGELRAREPRRDRADVRPRAHALHVELRQLQRRVPRVPVRVQPRRLRLARRRSRRVLPGQQDRLRRPDVQVQPDGRSWRRASTSRPRRSSASKPRDARRAGTVGRRSRDSRSRDSAFLRFGSRSAALRDEAGAVDGVLRGAGPCGRRHARPRGSPSRAPRSRLRLRCGCARSPRRGAARAAPGSPRAPSARTWRRRRRSAPARSTSWRNGSTASRIFGCLYSSNCWRIWSLGSMNFAYSVSQRLSQTSSSSTSSSSSRISFRMRIGQARLSALAANARTGSMASRPAATMPSNAASFSSWSVIDGSVAKVKRFRSASTASADFSLQSSAIASWRSYACARLLPAASAYFAAALDFFSPLLAALALEQIEEAHRRLPS